MSASDVVSSDEEVDDGRLLDRVARRDPTALGALYDRHGRVVFGILYRMLGSPEAAEEVVQDAFHSVWQRASTYRADRGSVRTWLMAIARNAAIDWRRTKGKRLERETVIEEAVELADEDRVDDRAIASLRAERVRSAVASLPAEQRDVLSLSFWSGLSQSEISERTGTPRHGEEPRPARHGEAPGAPRDRDGAVMTGHPYDDLAAYAIGVLDGDDQRAVTAHLADCTGCRADVRAFGETAWAIAESAARDAPPSLRAAIVDRARSSGAAPAAPALPAWLASLLDALRHPVPFAVPLALGLALVVSLVGFGSARRDADRYAAAVAGTAGARVVTLASTGELQGVRGSVVTPANGAAPFLVLDLPAAPSGKTWEAWVVRGETPIAAGITDGHGVTTLLLTVPLGAGDGVAITLEPAGGVDHVTGTPILAGKT
ncbi:MAG TPA: sigma-70 family RNA polymerase sigma factor [Candidatus Limnocylindria bacterium]|nr:sigma-70 family RNA polymerase sigma factor [Candidatus Limnocylindria bacterium]